MNKWVMRVAALAAILWLAILASKEEEECDG